MTTEARDWQQSRMLYIQQATPSKPSACNLVSSRVLQNTAVHPTAQLYVFINAILLMLLASLLVLAAEQPV